MSTPSDNPARVADDLAKATGKAQRDVKAAADQMTAASSSALNAGLDTANETSSHAASLAQPAADQAAQALEQSGQRLQTVTAVGVEAIGRLREISMEWVAVAQQGAERSLERMQALTGARSPQDLMAAQRNLLWGGLEDLAAAQQRIAQLTLSLWEDNAKRLTPASRELVAA